MASSFDVVPVTQYGILYSSASHQVDSETDYLYLPGRYYVSPGKRFILIPARRINLFISSEASELVDADYGGQAMLARTSDGLQISVNIFCQLRLIDEKGLSNPTTRSQVHKTFLKTMQDLDIYNNNKGYLSVVATVLETTALDVISTFPSAQIYLKRSALSDQLFVQFQAKMAQFGFQVPALMITNMAFTSTEIPDAIENTQILNQNVLQMLILENSKKLQLSYLQQVNIFDNQNSINSVTTQARVSMIKTNGTANGLNSAYSNLVLGITNMRGIIGSDFPTINFLIYLAIFKNTFANNQTLLLTNGGFF
jgi:hypothetical protein